MKRKTVSFLICFIFFSYYFCAYDVEAKINTHADKVSERTVNITEGNFLTTGENASEFKNNFMQSISMLFILTGIMVISIFFFKRVKSKNRNFSGALKIASNCYIGNNKKVSILEAGSQRFLIGITSSQITLLSELPPQEKTENIKRENPGNKGQSFRKYFENIVSPSSEKNLISRIINDSGRQNINLKNTD